MDRNYKEATYKVHEALVKLWNAELALNRADLDTVEAPTEDILKKLYKVMADVEELDIYMAEWTD